MLRAVQQRRSEASMDEFFEWLGPRKSKGIRMAVMDMWKPFRTSTKAPCSRGHILFDKFHVLRHLGEALDSVRKSEYARLTGKHRRFIKGQEYTLLSNRENLTLEGRWRAVFGWRSETGHLSVPRCRRAHLSSRKKSALGRRGGCDP